MKTFGMLLRSFSYAFDGLKYAFNTQLNMRIHMLAACIVSLFTLLLPLSSVEILFVAAAVFAVLVCELANTAMETVIDMISPSYHPLAKIAKDLAAAAVMVSAFFAVVVGGIIFLPLLVQVFREGVWNSLDVTLESLVAAGAMIFLAVSVCVRRGGQGYNNRQGRKQELSEVRQTPSEYTMLTEEERELLEQAIDVRQHAYVPYSRFQVGSAVRADNGDVYAGCNIENAAYGSTNCAERSALFHAVSRGATPRKFKMLAVVGGTEDPITPCGACRQVLAELCAPDMPVILANMDGRAIRTTVAELLPGAFTSQALDSDTTRSSAEEDVR